MIETIRRWLFPEEIRFLPGARAWSVAFRTLHLAAFGVLVGGHAFAVDAERLLPSLTLTILSGIGLVILELYAAGLYWVFLGKGITVLVKLGILLAIPFFWEDRVLLFLLVVGIASVSSHMPARFRHYSLLHGRVIVPGEPLGHGLSPVGPEVATITVFEKGQTEQG